MPTNNETAEDQQVEEPQSIDNFSLSQAETQVIEGGPDSDQALGGGQETQEMYSITTATSMEDQSSMQISGGIENQQSTETTQRVLADQTGFVGESIDGGQQQPEFSPNRGVSEAEMIQLFEAASSGTLTTSPRSASNPGHLELNPTTLHALAQMAKQATPEPTSAVAENNHLPPGTSSYDELQQSTHRLPSHDTLQMLEDSDPLSILASSAVSALSVQNDATNSLVMAAAAARAEANHLTAETAGASALATSADTLSSLSALTSEEDRKDGWADVAYTKFNLCQVKQYYLVNEKLSTMPPDTDVSRDLEFIKKRIELQPGTAYKFRVAAINACGRGPWSEVCTYIYSLISILNSVTL